MANSDRGQVGDAAAEVYEEFFVPALFAAWPEIVLDAAAAGRGQRVLDVACGTGVLARAAIHRVGGRGMVAGVDPNPAMLSVAARREGRVEWRQGYAEDLPFDDDAFDRVVSQFGMMFFTDPERALGEMARVLAPGGRVSIAVWASIEETPGYAAMVELLAELFGEDVAGALRTPYRLGDAGTLTHLVSRAFPAVEVERHAGTARFPSIDSWVHTDIRGWTLSESIDDRDFAALLGEARRRLGQFTDPAGRVSFAAPALIATAGESV